MGTEPNVPWSLADRLQTALAGPEFAQRQRDLVQREHDLAVARVTDQAIELTAQAAHRAEIRRTAEREARARATQQELIAAGIAVLVGLAVVIMLAVGVMVVTL